MTTSGGQLGFKKIIHGNFFEEKDPTKNKAHLRTALMETFKIFETEKELKSLAIPSQIGLKTKLQDKEVAKITIQTCRKYINTSGLKTNLQSIHFTNQEEQVCNIYQEILKGLTEQEEEKKEKIKGKEEKKEIKKKHEQTKKSPALPKGQKELDSQVITFGQKQFILKVIQGDLTKETTDAIVNAANSLLIHGAGLAKVIAINAGDSLTIECRKWKEKYKQLKVGEAMSTTAGFMPSKKVIHTVGPMGREKKEKNDAQLRWAAISSLKQCDRLGLKSIAIPAVSSGLFGFPKDRCAELIITATLDYFNASSVFTKIKEVHFTNIDIETCTYFVSCFREIVKKRMENKLSLGTGGFQQTEKEIYQDLSPVSIPLKKKGATQPHPTYGKGGGTQVKKGGVSYVKKGGK